MGCKNKEKSRIYITKKPIHLKLTSPIFYPLSTACGLGRLKPAVLSCPFTIYLYVLIMLFAFLLVLFTWPARDKPLRMATF